MSADHLFGDKLIANERGHHRIDVVHFANAKVCTGRARFCAIYVCAWTSIRRQQPKSVLLVTLTGRMFRLRRRSAYLESAGSDELTICAGPRQRAADQAPRTHSWASQCVGPCLPVTVAPEVQDMHGTACVLCAGKGAAGQQWGCAPDQSALRCT